MFFGKLEDGKAREVAGQVGMAVSKWRDEAARHGLTKAEIDRMASAFEHDDLKADARGAVRRTVALLLWAAILLSASRP